MSTEEGEAGEEKESRRTVIYKKYSGSHDNKEKMEEARKETVCKGREKYARKIKKPRITMIYREQPQPHNSKEWMDRTRGTRRRREEDAEEEQKGNQDAA